MRRATQEKTLYFISPAGASEISQMVGLKTKMLTGLHGDKMMMVLNTTLPGHAVPRQTHSHEQTGIVYSGKARLCIGDEERIVQKGDFYCIPSNVPHSDTCLGDEPFVMLDVFYPVREDYIRKLKQPSDVQ
jgi:quercetin dioxygenase-like cupin family protein